MFLFLVRMEENEKWRNGNWFEEKKKNLIKTVDEQKKEMQKHRKNIFQKTKISASSTLLKGFSGIQSKEIPKVNFYRRDGGRPLINNFFKQAKGEEEGQVLQKEEDSGSKQKHDFGVLVQFPDRDSLYKKGQEKIQKNFKKKYQNGLCFRFNRNEDPNEINKKIEEQIQVAGKISSCKIIISSHSLVPFSNYEELNAEDMEIGGYKLPIICSYIGSIPMGINKDRGRLKKLTIDLKTCNSGSLWDVSEVQNQGKKEKKLDINIRDTNGLRQKRSMIEYILSYLSREFPNIEQISITGANGILSINIENGKVAKVENWTKEGTSPRYWKTRINLKKDSQRGRDAK